MEGEGGLNPRLDAEVNDPRDEKGLHVLHFSEGTVGGHTKVQ